MNKPTVSIILCTYNGARFIREQLDSIVAQNYPLLEVIIQDDGSTDDTVAICNEYAARFPYIKVRRNEHNLGFNLNFKSAAMRAQGDFVAISDQDDVWMADKIETLVAHIGDHDICFSTHLRGRTPEDSHTVSPQYSLEALLFGGFAGHTMLLRRDFIQTEEYWIDHIHYDWSLALCAQLHRGIVRVDRPLNWHRQHELRPAPWRTRPSAAVPWARPHGNPTPMAGPTTVGCSRSPTGAPSTSISTTIPPPPNIAWPIRCAARCSAAVPWPCCASA